MIGNLNANLNVESKKCEISARVGDLAQPFPFKGQGWKKHILSLIFSFIKTFSYLDYLED